LYQTQYLFGILHRYNMDATNSAPTPMELGIKFNKNDYPKSPIDKVHMFSYPYSQAVGSFMHAIINSRLNCVFIISNLAQYMSNPSISH